jgi:hypothetical protein
MRTRPSRPSILHPHCGYGGSGCKRGSQEEFEAEEEEI